MKGHETPENHPLTILKGFSTVSEGVLGKGGCKLHPLMFAPRYLGWLTITGRNMHTLRLELPYAPSMKGKICLRTLPFAKTNDEGPDFFIAAVFGLIISALMNHLTPLPD
jgi:hypothetical protein